MSAIDRMKILGIRNFGPDKGDEGIVKFYSPLTLILGENGCGKTTIIEALKYATCGELPAGTDSGSGFVFDPKLAQANEVKATVKLSCKDAKGEKKEISRIVRVQQKMKKLEFSTLSATLTSKNESVDNRCVDINSTVCQFLGVSRAILTNVIFCHQEDSLWPLEKGKKIKEKFDAIFGITEYNKCIEHIRNLSKEYTTKKSEYKKDVEWRSKFWEETKEKKRKLETFRASLVANQDNINEIDAQLQPTVAKLREIIEKETNFAKFTSNVVDQKNRRKIIMETINETSKDIKEKFHGSKDTLVLEIELFEDNLKKSSDKIQDLLSENEDLNDRISRSQKDIDSQMMVIGHLQRDEDDHHSRIKIRNDRLKTQSNELGLPFVSSSQTDDVSSEQVITLLKGKISELHMDLKSMQEEHKQLETSIQNNIFKKVEKNAALEQETRSKQKLISDSTKEIKKLENEIEEVNKSNQRLHIIETSLSEVNNDIAELNSSFNVNEQKSKIEQNEEIIKNLDKECQSLEKEEKEIMQYDMKRTSLNNFIENVKRVESDFNNLLDKNKEKFMHLLSEVPKFNFKQSVQTHINKLESDIGKMEKCINDNEHQLCRLTEKKRNLNDQIRQKNLQASRDEEKIEALCGQRTVTEFYESATSNLKYYSDLKGTIQASKYLYEKFVKNLSGPGAICPTCKREFESEDQVKEVSDDMYSRLAEYPEKIKEYDIEVIKYSNQQKKASELTPVESNMKNIKEVELPKLKDEIQKVEGEIKKFQSEISDSRDNIQIPQADKIMASELLSDAVLMDRYCSQITSIKKEIKIFEDTFTTSCPERSLAEVSSALGEKKDRLGKVRSTLSSDQRDLSSFNERYNQLTNKQTNLTSQKLNIAGNAQKRKILTEQLDDLRNSQLQMKKELELAQNQLGPITQEVNELKAKLKNTQTQTTKLVEDRRKNILEIERKVEEIDSMHFTIVKYRNEGHSDKLKTKKEKLIEKRDQKSSLENKRKKICDEIDTANELKNTHLLKKHNLECNLKVMTKQEELKEAENKIQELMGQMNTINYDQLMNEKKQLHLQRDKFERRKAMAEGESRQIKQRILDTESELDKDDYKNSENQYRKYSIKLAVTTKAIDDLKLYETAMDWAMIHFHKERMKMINTTVRELWRAIYRGNDIDWIEIKTDDTSTSSSTSAKRTYNYKVIQMKNGVELDMLGRCSAGQKVLACLIIRMALAETFSKNCGILTLDEPTTNLDRTNIDSLSEALAEIVEKRANQKNFQLVIITHDEEFLKKLAQIEKVERYLVVYRDERGRSKVVERENS